MYMGESVLSLIMLKFKISKQKFSEKLSKNFLREVALFNIFKNLFNEWFNGSRLDSGFYSQSVAMLCVR